jgi:tetratricopeptide (TPR) repeat protein
MRWAVMFLLSLGVSVVAQQQGAPGSQQAGGAAQQGAPAAHHQANFDALRQQANTLFLAGKSVDAVPLYEELSRQDPTIGVFAERHGVGLLAKADLTSDPKVKGELRAQGLAEIRRAQALGDNSPYVDSVLNAASKTPAGAAAGAPLGMPQPTVGYTHVGSAKAQPLYAQAEQAFAQQNWAAAAPLYVKASQTDPQWYMPALNAGDAYFHLKDWKNANVWFGKAVAIDPNRETAYRYWGDELFAAGDRMGAKAKYVSAIIAEPYTAVTWAKLEEWAKVTKTPFVILRVKRPEFTTPNGSLKVDTALEKETGDGRSSWLVYERVRAAHGATAAGQLKMAGAVGANGEFTPSGYVHTLDEEMAALNAMLADVQKNMAAGTVSQQKLDPGIKDMLTLQRIGYLEPFVMLNFHDAGLRHGYPAYRSSHQDLLVKYLNNVVAPGFVR